MSKQLKCFHVQKYNADYQEHIFAETRGKAIAQSEAYGWDGEFTKVQAVRKPEYDKYSDQGYVPVEILLKDGWWFECGRCYRTLTQDDDYAVNDEIVYCKEHAKEGIGDE